MIGYGQMAGGIGLLLGKLSTFIPGKVEKLKNELDNLTKERNELLKGKATIQATKRIIFIDKRTAYINQLLRNKAQD